MLHVWEKKEKELIRKTSGNHTYSLTMNHHAYQTKLVHMAAYLSSALSGFLVTRQRVETGIYILPDNIINGVCPSTVTV